MKKQRSRDGIVEPVVNNPVAKFAYRFNKHQIFADKRRYQRKAKHRGLEPFAILSTGMMANGFATNGCMFQGSLAQ